MSDEEVMSEGEAERNVLSEWANEPEKEPEKPEEPAEEAAPAGVMPGDKPAEEKPEKEPEKSPEPKRTYKQKVNGKDEEFDAEEVDRFAQRLGISSQEVLSAAGLKRASYENMKEAARLRKEAERAIEILRKDPLEAARRAGLTGEEIEKFIQQKALELYEREYGPDGKPLSAEQRQALEWRQKAEAADREKREREAEQKADEERQAAAEMEQRWVRTIIGKLEASKLPKAMVPLIAKHMSDLIGHDRGVNPEDVVDDAADLALEDMDQVHSAVYEGMEWPKFRERFPKIVEKVRAGLLADFKARKGAPKAAPGKVDVVEREKPERGPRVLTDVGGFLRGWAR